MDVCAALDGGVLRWDVWLMDVRQGGQWKQEAGASVWSVLRREAARGGLLVGIQERTGEEGSPEAVSEMFHRISCQCSSALE